MKHTTDIPRRWRIAILSTAFGLLAAVGMRSLTAQPSPASQPADPAAIPATGPAAVAELKRLYASFEKNLRSLPRDRFDVAAVAELCGRDADDLKAWVGDNTDALPYRGALRGSTGVLMDRAGNSLDRALLLAELLQGAGYEVRLANATLQEAQAEQVLKLASAPRKRAGAVTDIAEAQAARARAQAQAERLLTALGPPPSATNQAAQMAAVADHWWVQRQQAGQWVDVDLYGLSGLTPAQTLPLSANPAQLPLDPKDLHEVELRVVIEVLRGGKLTSDRVLTHKFRTAENLGRTINFRHTVGKPIPEPDMEDGAEARKRLRANLVGQEVFLPVLLVEDRTILEASFTTDGTIDRNPRMNPAGELGGKMADVFGGLTGSPDAGPKGVLTAEWIEYEIRVPGQQPQTVRRPVFDLIGPAARAAGVSALPPLEEPARLSRALAMVSQTQIFLQPCDLSPMFVMYQQARAEIRDKQYWINAVEGAPGSEFQMARGFERLGLRDATSSLFALMRRAIGPAPDSVYVDQPNIIHFRDLVEPALDGGMTRRRGMDLAFTSTAALSAPDEAFAIQVRQGVADTLAEHLALGDGASPDENTVGVFEAAAQPGLVRAADAASVQKMQLPADAAARAKADVDQGHVLVLASSTSGRWSWWRVNAATGQTIGVMDNGYHAALTEQEAQYERQLIGFNRRLKPPMKPKDFLDMSKDQIKEWGKDPDTITNLLGLQADWKALILRRGMRAMFIPG